MRDVEQRPAVQVDVRRVDVGQPADDQALTDERGVAQQRAVRAAVERGGVEQQHRIAAGRRRRRGRSRVAGREERFVAPAPSSRRAAATARRAGALPRARRGRCRRSRPPATPRRAGVEVVEHERQLVGGLAPVGRAEDRAELRRGEEQLDDAERVLPEPQDAVAGPDARRRRAPARAGSPGRRARRYVRRTSPSTDGELLRPRAAVLAQQVAETGAVQRRRPRRILARDCVGHGQVRGRPRSSTPTSTSSSTGGCGRTTSIPRCATRPSAFVDDEVGNASVTVARARARAAPTCSCPGETDAIGERRRRERAGLPPERRYDEALPRDYWDPRGARRAARPVSVSTRPCCSRTTGCCGSARSTARCPRSLGNMGAWNRWCATVVSEGARSAASGRAPQPARSRLARRAAPPRSKPAGVRLAMIAPGARRRPSALASRSRSRLVGVRRARA